MSYNNPKAKFTGEIEPERDEDGNLHFVIPSNMLNASEGQRFKMALYETDSSSNYDDAPVDTGDTREVTIQDIGDQGDGITRIDRGFVLVVPDTEVGDEVEVEITDVKDSFAFAQVI